MVQKCFEKVKFPFEYIHKTEFLYDKMGHAGTVAYLGGDIACSNFTLDIGPCGKKSLNDDQFSKKIRFAPPPSNNF